MSNIQKYSKPEMIRASESVKLRDMPAPERLKHIKDMVDLLLVDLAVSGRADPNHHVSAIKFIRDHCSEFTLQEIFLAFKKFIKGDFKEKAMQQFNSVVVGNVMREYKEWKQEGMRVYKSKRAAKDNDNTPTQEEKDQIMEEVKLRCIAQIAEHGKFENRLFHHLYDYLVDQKKEISFSKEERKAYYKRAIKIEKAEAMRDAKISYDKHRTLKATIAFIENGKSARTKKLAKSLILEDYFRDHY